MKKNKPASHDIYSKNETNIINLVLKNANRNSTAVITYEAPWLLSHFSDDVWITTNRGRELLINGKWSSSIAIVWDFTLPDGSKFTDPKYSALLELSKKIAFRLRDGGVDGSFGVVSWRVVINDLKNLISWMVINKKRIGPENYLFSKITQRDIDSLMYLIACGGWFNALNLPIRVLDAVSSSMGKSLPSEIDSDNVMSLPTNYITTFVEWFDANGFYKKVYRGVFYGKRFIHRGMIAELIGVDPSTVIASRKFSSFLRQFEPDFSFTPLVVSVVQRHEFPDQNTLSRDKFKNLSIRRKDFDIIAESLFKIFKMASVINRVVSPNYLADLPKKSNLKYGGLCEGQGRTKFIPMNIGLSYFNAAIRWIECYGDAIVNCYIDSIGSIDSYNYTKIGRSSQGKCKANSFLTLDLKSYKFKHSKLRNISEFIDKNNYSRSSVKFGFNEMRDRPSLEEAIRILIGACVVCISISKPSRNDEIVHLDRECLALKDDGYYLSFNLGKSNHNDYYQEAEKPIPFIAAKAIKLLQRLGETVEKISKPENKSINKGKLFNLPSYSVGRPRLIASNLLCDYLDVFCDYVNLPPIDGVRWYIRIHEMRKWFLLLLFWSGRNDVLDACRWIAGHTDSKHIYNYIQHEFPGEELPVLEAQYAMDRLLELEMRGNGEKGLKNVYKNILSHFKVEAISLIPATEWEDYVTEMHKRNEFTIEHQFIYDKKSANLTSVNVSFVMRVL